VPQVLQLLQHLGRRTERRPLCRVPHDGSRRAAEQRRVDAVGGVDGGQVRGEANAATPNACPVRATWSSSNAQIGPNMRCSQRSRAPPGYAVSPPLEIPSRTGCGRHRRAPRAPPRCARHRAGRGGNRG
jgi:hypothetical protein